MLATGLLGLVLGVAGMVIANWWQSKAPFLRYTPGDTVIFQGDTNHFGLLNCSVTNEGTKQADDADIFIELAGSTFVEMKATPASLNPVVVMNKEKTNAHITVKMLNPDESFQVVAMASNPEKLPSRPDFKVRANGVTGTMEAKPPEHYFNAFAFFGFLTLFGLSFGVAINILITKSRK
jgi:hypothetical protein